jgi:hypothetical protein
LVSTGAVVLVFLGPDSWLLAGRLFAVAVVLLAVGRGAFGDGTGPYGVVPDRPSSK